jgi:hypothetical protein
MIPTIVAHKTDRVSVVIDILPLAYSGIARSDRIPDRIRPAGRIETRAEHRCTAS